MVGGVTVVLDGGGGDVEEESSERGNNEATADRLAMLMTSVVVS
jgi:hypothetical protein